MNYIVDDLKNYSVEELIEHAVGSIRSADVFATPYPHIFFREFLPADFYVDLLNTAPDDAAFECLNRDGTRLAARIYGDHVEAADPNPEGCWRKVSSLLQSRELEEAIRDMLAEGLEIRRKGERLKSADDLKTIAKPVIYKDLDGYRIKPHPDTRKKVVTMQIYLPRDESQKELGTTLYRVSPKGALRFNSWMLDPVKTFPFLPNVGYAFVVIKPQHNLMKTSWHGRPTISATPNQPRMSVLNTFYADEALGF